MSDLNDRLLAAHATNDRAALVALYAEAADQADDTDSACFYLTHAMVFALELGLPAADDLRRRLAAHGREVGTPL
ncbi:hypothetical protein TRL7639_01736 [Falsiruegeria litorea R37]|uniref:Uncharacterized protein n=1 Tax=Falsiruegeria litorea R37 TaxID=1200284 RepID=A0A1Y5SA83_9RHOB|nr:hypothetical protein [Falsiruegeria litorea]SLN36141.1 hypothetical protein TRL7639_01736 [Falsiruegeria litorea R37]